jgi:hypothetical protein
MSKKTLIVRFKSGPYGIINRGYSGNEWNFLHLCDNLNHVDIWLNTLSINRRYVAYRYY